MEIAASSLPSRKGLLQPKVLISSGFLLAFYLLIRCFEGAPIPDYPFGGLTPQTALITSSLLAMACMWWWHGKSWSYHLLIHICALGLGTATLMAWAPYTHGCGAVYSDAWFSTAMVTKYKADWWLPDFGYKGLHAFYPSLYHYVVAKLSVLSGTTAILGMKYGVYWTAFLLPLAAYGLWRKLLDELPAFLMVVAAMMICRTNLAFKPFEVIAINVFIPWALYYVAGYRRRLVDGTYVWDQQPLGRRDLILGGLIGGLCFLTYYYYFFLLVVWLPLDLIVSLRNRSFREEWKRYRQLALMAGIILLISSPYWLPMVLDMVRLGGKSYQNRWFAHHMFGLPFDWSNQWKGLLGLGLLISMAPRNQFARGILVMLIAVLGFILVGHVGMYLDFPLLHFRIVGVEEYLMNLGLIMGLLHWLRKLKPDLEPGWEKAIPVTFMTVYFIGMGMGFMWEKGRDTTTEAARAVLPDLVKVPEFTEFSRGKVFLTNQQKLAAYRPLYLFIVPNAHYSHPAARYRDRLKMLVLLSQSHDSNFISWMLQHNRYDRVDFVSLEYNRLDLSDDNFPESIPHIGVTIQFHPDAFDGQYFRRDPGFQEILHVEPMPAGHWRQFTPEQQLLVAMFSDVDKEEVRGRIPPTTLKAIDDELRIRTKDYPMWQRVFWFKYLGGW